MATGPRTNSWIGQFYSPDGSTVFGEGLDLISNRFSLDLHWTRWGTAQTSVELKCYFNLKKNS